MLSFWVLVGLLTCTATALVVWPLIKRRDTADAPASTDESRRLAVYRDRRREIRAEFEAGRLTREESEQAERELVADAARQFPALPLSSRAAHGRAGLAWAIAAAIVIPVVALGVYDRIGAPGVIALDADTLRGTLSPERVQQAIRELGERVARKPDDGEGWAMLAEAHRLNDDPAQAAQAYEKATSLLPANARLLADYAETLVILSKGNFAGKPVELLERALRVDPKDGKAVALMGAAQYRLGNLEEALRHLKALAAAMPEDSQEVRPLSEAITRIEGELAARGTKGSTGATAPSSPDRAPSGAAAAGAISGTVAIDDSLRAQVARGAVMFIVARAPEGSRVPIAALRVPIGTAWPVRFELSDAQAMDPSRLLSQAGPVVIEARISASGDAMRRSGDPFGVSAPTKPGARDVGVRIDRRVP